MKHRFWIDLLISAAAAFVPVLAVTSLYMAGLSELAGLLAMGMLILGWPGFAVWLGIQVGKDIRGLWPLLPLFSVMMIFVFPYFGGFPLSLGYAGVVLVLGLIPMGLSRLVK